MPYRTVDWRSCDSMSENHELEKIEGWCELVASRREAPLFMAEIGSYRGRTAALLAQFGDVLCLDLWGELDDGEGHYDQIGTTNWKEFTGNMTRLGLICHGVFPTLCTSDFLPVMGGPFDLIFVDGSHKYEEVTKDIENSISVLADDGLIVVHDYKRPGYGYPPFDPTHPHHGPVDPWWGVARAVDELVERVKACIASPLF